jgi:hypothetical protein
MRVALRHDRRLKPEQALNFVEIYARLDEASGEGMPEIAEMKIVDKTPSGTEPFCPVTPKVQNVSMMTRPHAVWLHP